MNICLEKYQNVGSFSHRNFIKFHDFFGIDFRIGFLSIFDGKWLPEWSGKSPAGRPFFHLFRDLVIYVDFMLNLAHFWLPFGALWLTLGSLLLTLGSLLLTFGSLLVPFGSLLVPWAHFWRSWRSIFSLLVPPSVIFHISFYNMDGILVPKPAHRHLHA